MKRIGSPLIFFLLYLLITATLSYAGTDSNSDNVIQWSDSIMVVQPKVRDNDDKGVENPLTLTDVQKEMTIEANFKARNSAVDFSNGTKSCFLNAIEN